jgi:hypothetical protein
LQASSNKAPITLSSLVRITRTTKPESPLARKQARGHGDGHSSRTVAGTVDLLPASVLLIPLTHHTHHTRLMPQKAQLHQNMRANQESMTIHSLLPREDLAVNAVVALTVMTDTAAADVAAASVADAGAAPADRST